MKNMYIMHENVIYKTKDNGLTRIVDLNIFFRRFIAPILIILFSLILMGMWWNWSNGHVSEAFEQHKVVSEELRR